MLRKLHVFIFSIALLPLGVLATDVSRSVNGERGNDLDFVSPEHRSTSKTRAEVLGELDAARKDGSHALQNTPRGFPPEGKVSLGKSPLPVQESPGDKRNQRDLYRGGN